MTDNSQPRPLGPYLTDPNGKEHPVNLGPFTIGRAVDCDVVISSMSVSREHARIYHEGRHWFINDLGSTNGTFLNGERIGDAQGILDGDSIKIGDVTFLFHDPDTTVRETPFPDLDSNESSGVVKVNRQVVSLSAKEFLLLKYLHTHKGQVCSKDDIGLAVWPEYENGEIFDYQVENLVRRLRTRIESDPSNPQILLTVRGLGYKLIAR